MLAILGSIILFVPAYFVLAFILGPDLALWAAGFTLAAGALGGRRGIEQ